MKPLKSIPTGKVERASKFISTGAKLGANYVKHYVKKAIDPTISNDALNAENAKDLYDALSKMKGSVLKLAQMMSMDQGILPKEYVDKFSLSQFQTPPLSGPLVSKIFRNYFGKNPESLFDTFNIQAKHAASIGQVHEASKDGKKLAVKIQYPGVADSIKSDIKLVKPFATKLMNVKNTDIDRYINEVETKLLEETNYILELNQGLEIAQACQKVQNIAFPEYIRELSNEKIITMSWVEGIHLKDFIQSSPSQELRNTVGQALWDFYMLQNHVLKKMHADPHPGNFIVSDTGQVTVIDFGCVKQFSQGFYENFWRLADPAVQNNEEDFNATLKNLEMLLPTDSPERATFFAKIYKDMLEITTKPFSVDTFDFGDESLMKSMYAYGEYLGTLDEFKKDIEPRGSNHFIYVNRTFYGLYSLLSMIKCEIQTYKGKLPTYIS